MTSQGKKERGNAWLRGSHCYDAMPRQGRRCKNLLVGILDQSRGSAKNHERRMGYVREAVNTMSSEVYKLGANLLFHARVARSSASSVRFSRAPSNG